MSATPPNLGVAASSPTPAVPAPTWPDAASLSPISTPLPVSTAPVWPRSALWATVLLLFVALALMAWNVYGGSRFATRPTTLERGALQKAKLDLNRADRVQLMQLNGVGETLATRIVTYREENNGFTDVEELRQVSGIGPALIEKLRPHVCVVPFENDEEAEPNSDPKRLVLPRNKPTKNPAANKPTTTKKVSDLTRPIDINRASAEELQRLPGIGPTLSGRIMAARQKEPFKKVDDLRRVSGIGVKTLEKLRPLVTIGEAEDEKKE